MSEYYDQVKKMVFDEKLSHPEIAERLGKSLSSIQSYCSRHEILTKPRKIPPPVDKEELIYLIENKELQQDKVADLLGVNVSTIERYCKRWKLKTQRTGPKRGELHPDWNGGIRIQKGYRYIYSPDHPNCTKQRCVAEHRLVMEQKLGRYLLKKEVVHHVDGNPLNNNPDNLMVFGSNGDHLHHELKGKCPNWSDAGKEVLRKTVLEIAERRKQKSIQNQKESDGQEQSL